MSFDSRGFFAVQSKDVDAESWWIRPLLQEFERKTCLVSVEDVLSQARTADAQLWSYYDGERVRGVVATRLHKTARGLLCNIWICIGMDAVELIDGFYKEIEDWARSKDCFAIEVVGRPGWGKKLPGFKRTAIVLEKPLT